MTNLFFVLGEDDEELIYGITIEKVIYNYKFSTK